MRSLSKDLCLFPFGGTFTDLSTSLRYGRDDNHFFETLSEWFMRSLSKDLCLFHLYRCLNKELSSNLSPQNTVILNAAQLKDL